MKAKLIIIIFLVFRFTGSAQSAGEYNESIYEISVSKNDRSSTAAFIKSMVAPDIRYIIRSNDSLYSIEAGTIDEIENEHVHTNISGPQKILFNINKDVVLFDENKPGMYRLSPVEFLNTGFDTVINNYKCNLVLSLKRDSLYISKQLPVSINPFILTSKSIKGGVVKAVMADGTLYKLTALSVKKGEPFQRSLFTNMGKIQPKKNIFFE